MSLGMVGKKLHQGRFATSSLAADPENVRICTGTAEPSFERCGFVVEDPMEGLAV
jgi:hypothetical protein